MLQLKIILLLELSALFCRQNVESDGFLIYEVWYLCNVNGYILTKGKFCVIILSVHV
jgi:hypothetical protein